MNGSLKEGEKINNDNTKLVLRAFNYECDVNISKVKFNNITVIQTKIEKSFESLNKLSSRLYISLRRPYLDLKILELHLAYEYELKKQAEYEEQQKIKEEMREEQKVLKELEAAKLKIEKEEKHFTQEIDNLKLKLSDVDDAEKSKFL